MEFIAIFFYTFCSSCIFIIYGLIFNTYLFKSNNSNKNLYECAIFGLITISFIALFVNFFVSLNQLYNTVILIFPLIFFFTSYKKFINYIFFKNAFIISLISFLILVLENSYRPDAGLYHLPFTSILNESKIIIGVTNIHFRFGHTSILQYLSAIFNNYLFTENGQLIPISIIFSLTVCFFGNEFVKKNNDPFVKYLSGLLLICVLVLMNRYSEFGNDHPAHMLFLITFFIFIKEKKDQNTFNKIYLYACYIFTIKQFLIFIFLFPLWFLIKNTNLIKLNRIKISIISLFLLLWIIKNILTSSCLLYPVNITCADSLSWTVNSSDETNASITKIEGEAWAKDFPNRFNKAISETEYLKNFNWLKTWANNHLFIILKKLTPILILFSLFILFPHKNFNKNHYLKYRTKIKYSFYITIGGLLFWLLKFPLYRYGISYLIIPLLCLSIFLIKRGNQFLKRKKLINFIIIVIIIASSITVIKNIYRIIKNYNTIYTDYPWPKKNSYTLLNERNENIPVKNELGEILYYRPYPYTLCMYSKAPCSTQENISIIKTKKFGYEIIINKTR
jgi:hypothetical protein